MENDWQTYHQQTKDRNPSALLKEAIQFVKNKTEFISKITAAAVVEELYKTYGILTTITPSKQGMIAVTPSIIAQEEDMDYFVNSLDAVLQKGLIPLTNHFVASTFKKMILQ
mgnify:CR=1 FL=1